MSFSQKEEIILGISSATSFAIAIGCLIGYLILGPGKKSSHHHTSGSEKKKKKMSTTDIVLLSAFVVFMGIAIVFGSFYIYKRVNDKK